LSARYARRRSAFRSIANAVVIVLAAGLAWLGLQKPWLPGAEGRFTAIDGDSLRQGAQEYRLHAIDAPELHQDCRDAAGAAYPCGREAREALRALIANQPLACAVSDTDRYGRLVATCRAGGRDINGEMVRQGWAIAYRRHGRTYVGAEDEARAARRGIWQGTFQAPEDWRNERRKAMSRGGLAEEPLPPD
jgi:endonuclease YncB( thermonuclease family)